MKTAKLSLVESFSELEDPRERCCKHNFLEVVMIVILAVMCGMEGWSDIVLFAKTREQWLKETLHMQLEGGIPSVSTFSRIISSIEPAKFQTCFINWTQSASSLLEGDVIALDGKTNRGSKSKKRKPIHIVSAWANRNGISLGQKAVDEKTNEITAIPELLAMLVIKGCIITIDAMGCQKAIAELVIEKEAEYVLGLKGNQKIFAQQVKDHLTKLFDSPNRKDIDHDYYEAPVELGHGRIESRKCLAIPVVASEKEFDSVHFWAGIKSVALIERTRIDKVSQTTTTERECFISSLKADAKNILRCVREHWGIEAMHWVMDVSFGEDDSRIRIDNASENISACRKIAHFHLKEEKSCKLSIRQKQKKAAMDTGYHEKVIRNSLKMQA